jgi:hypothetical protein
MTEQETVMTLTYDEITLGPDAYSSEPARGGGPEYTRVYLRRARVAHLREALCPALDRAGYDSWLGTGSQPEYEHAVRLPLCSRCFAWRESYLDDERLGTGHRRKMT